MIRFKDNYEETLQRFDAYFHGQRTDRPLLYIWTPRTDKYRIDMPPMEEIPFVSAEDIYLNTEKNYARCFNHNLRFRPRAEAFPNFSMNLGAGSLALYLGSEPEFRPETVWFGSVSQENEPFEKILPLKYNESNHWWQKHLDIIRRQKELTHETDIMVCVPDLIENLDILAALRGPQQFCYDIYDYPGQVGKALDDISEIYPLYYDRIYDIVKKEDGSSAYTAFSIMGKGKTAKLQCDFAALISCNMFDEFVVPSLRRQCGMMNNVLFHLDGPECIRHIKSLMTIDGIGALQWTPGAGNPPAGDECWDELYREVVGAGRGLWIALWEYGREEAVARADRLVKKFGSRGFYFLFGNMSDKEADELLIKAEHDWKN